MFPSSPFVLRSLALWAVGSLLVPPGSLHAQGQTTDPLSAPRGMTVYFLDVGQGDSTLVLGPGGKVLLMDGGPNGQGTKVILPLLSRLGIKHIDYLVSSHYHPDHLGGLDEVMAKVTVGQVWDRGTWLQPGYADYKRYVQAASKRRKTAPLGLRLDLGGGASARVLAANGKVLGGKTVAIKGRYQAENAASLVLKVEFGDFDLWLGGDLTGGGSKTPDVESQVAPVCGDVEVYKMNHHGSHTSSNATLLRYLDPEVAIASMGYKNPFKHPSTTALNRFNKRASSRLVVGTTAGAGWAGFTNMGTIRLQTDGWRYRVENLRGEGVDLYVDEHRGRSPRAGDLVFSEIQRQTKAPEGEYVELFNRSGFPLDLGGLQVSSSSGSFTVPVSYRLLPGASFLFFRHGDSSKSGGLPFGHCWPYKAMSLGDKTDTLQLTMGRVTLDRISYGSGFPGGRGVAAEKRNLEAFPSKASDFVAASKAYGQSWDKGSPAARNTGDRTAFPMRSGAEILDSKATGGKALHLFGTALSDPTRFHVLAMSLGNRPGIQLGKVHLGLNPDSLLTLSVGIPGFMGILPASGLRAVRLPLPPASGLRGTKIWFAHLLLNPSQAPFFPKVSSSIQLILP